MLIYGGAYCDFWHSWCVTCSCIILSFASLCAGMSLFTSEFISVTQWHGSYECLKTLQMDAFKMWLNHHHHPYCCWDWSISTFLRIGPSLKCTPLNLFFAFQLISGPCDSDQTGPSRGLRIHTFYVMSRCNNLPSFYYYRLIAYCTVYFCFVRSFVLFFH